MSRPTPARRASIAALWWVQECPAVCAPTPFAILVVSDRNYQNKEHMKAFWPMHKAFCKSQQQTMQHWTTQPKPDGLPSSKERKYLVEDWISLHQRSLDEAIAWAIHDCSPPFDLSRQYLHFDLKFRPESEGNPSLAFMLVSARVANLPPKSTPLGAAFSSTVLIQLEASHEHDKENVKGYVTAVPCLCLYPLPLPVATRLSHNCSRSHG